MATGVMKASKQASRKVAIDGYVFDSIPESKRYQVLAIRALVNMIQDLQVHPKFTLLEKIPKVVGAITYEADFSYWYEGKLILEDVKATYSNTKKNRAKGIAGRPIVTEASRLRHKLIIAQLWHKYGKNAEFRIVTDIDS
jgi:hypothetical protein